MLQLNWPEAIVIVAFLVFALGVIGIFTAGRKPGMR
jgi:NADH:ubiquinone oxidoreductase subunit K